MVAIRSFFFVSNRLVFMAVINKIQEMNCLWFESQT